MEDCGSVSAYTFAFGREDEARGFEGLGEPHNFVAKVFSADSAPYGLIAALEGFIPLSLESGNFNRVTAGSATLEGFQSLFEKLLAFCVNNAPADSEAFCYLCCGFRSSEGAP